jgi:hypothetical protein
MASNYPTNLDSFTNPTSGDKLDSPSHSTQHADANDAIEALETKIGIGASSAGSATTGQFLVIGGGGSSSWSSSLSAATISASTISSSVLTSPEETITITATASSGTVDANLITGGVTFATANATANWVLNLRGDVSTTLNSLISVGQSISHTYLNTNGTGVFYPTAFRIDGTAVTPNWQAAGTPTTGNANSLDAYSLTVIKTATTPTYTVLASQTRFA